MNFKKLKKAKVSFVGKFIAATILGMSAAFFAPDVCKNTSFRVLAEGTITTEIALQLMETHYDKNTKTLNLSDTDFTEIGEYAFACRKNKNFEKTKIFEQIEEVILPPNCEKIGRGAFRGCDLCPYDIKIGLGSQLKKVTIPSSVNTIGDEAFGCCFRLENVNFIDTPTTPSKLKFIGNNVFWRTSIKKLNIPNGCQEIGTGIFRCCCELEEFSIPRNVAFIKELAFVGCKNLKKFNVRNGTEITSYYLKDLKLPESIESIGASSFGGTMVVQCTVPSNVSTIEWSTFNSCFYLKSIELPKNLHSIGNQALCQCRSLSQVTVPGQVKTIGDMCFFGCYRLNQVEALGNDIVLGKDCFGGCYKLQIVCFPNAEKITSTGPLISDFMVKPIILVSANTKINDKKANTEVDVNNTQPIKSCFLL